MGGLWPIVLRSLAARPLRAVLTAVAVALGVAAVTGVQLAVPALDAQAARAQQQRAGGSQLDVRAVQEPGFDAATVASLAALPGVRAAAPLDEKRVLGRADPTSISALTVTVVGVHLGAAGLRPVELVEGRLPAEGSTDEVTLDAGLAAALESTGAPRPLITGDDVRLLTGSGSSVFHVVGISSGTSAGAAFTRSAAFVSEKAMHGPFARGLHTPLVALELATGTSAGAAAAEVHDLLGGDAVAVDPRALATQPLSQLRPLLALVTVLSVVIGGFVVANTMWLGVVERRREIGLLRAAGGGRRHVFLLFLAEAAALAALGAAAGVGAGIVLAGVLVGQLAPSDLGVPTVEVGGLTVVAAVALGLALALIGAFVPARSAARMKPLDALRAGGAGAPERSPRWLLAGVALLLAAAAGTLATGLVESTAVGVVVLLAGTVLLLPFLVPPLLHRVSRRRRLAARTTGLAAANLARAGNRTSLTVAGLVVAVGVSVAVGALTAGALAAGDRWVGGLFIGDVVVRSPAPQPLDVAGAFSRQAGVANAVPLRFLSGEVAGETLGITVIQPPMYRASTALDLDGADRSAALDALDPATPPALIAPRQLADLLGWRPGLTVSVAGQNGPVPFTIAAVAAHTYPGGDGRESVVIGSAAAGRVLGDVATGFDALDVTRGSAPMAAVESAASAFGMQAVSVATVQDATQAAVDHSVVLLSAFAWVAVVVAMLAVVNTLMVNVRQGARELGLLRAVGLSRRRAQRLVLTQAGLLALTGTAVGIGLGCLLAVPLIHASGGPGFDPGFVFPVWSVALSVAAVVLGALAAVLVPSRRAARQSIVGAIRQA